MLQALISERFAESSDLQQSNPADAPILTLALTSKTMPLTKVEDFADTRLAQKFRQLPGVAW